MSLLRPISSALAANMANGVPLWKADLFVMYLADGVTTYAFTSWDEDLTVGAQLYASARPWLKRGRLRLVNTMEVPTLDVTVLADNTAWGGATSFKQAAHNGFLDGASFRLTALYMTAPGVVDAVNNLVVLFLGDVGQVEIDGISVKLNVKGRNNKLDRPFPRNMFQSQCRFGFCDAQCGLTAASYTTTNTVGSGSGGATRTFLPWGSAPTTNPAGPGKEYLFKNGTITFTSGTLNGQQRNVVASDATGVTVSPPWIATPTVGDPFTALQGCSKDLYNPIPTTGVSAVPAQVAATCSMYANAVRYGGFPWVPPPEQGGQGPL